MKKASETKEKVLTVQEIFEHQKEIVNACTDVLRELTSGRVKYSVGKDGYLVEVNSGHQIFITKPEAVKEPVRNVVDLTNFEEVEI